MKHRTPRVAFGDDKHALTLTRYRVIKLPWSAVKGIMAEFDQSEQLLRDALRTGHQLEIDDTDGKDPDLFFIVDSQQKEKLAEYRIPNPTLLQVIGTSRVIATSENDARKRFEQLLTENN